MTLRAVQHLRPIVADVADELICGFSLHLVGIEGPQQVDREISVPLSLCAAGIAGEPTSVVGGFQDYRHAVVDRRHELVSLCGDDAIALQPASIRILPGVPQSSKRERLAVLHREGIGLFRLRVELLPFVESISGHETAAALEGYAPYGVLCDGLGASVDGGEAFEVGQTVGEVRYQAPTHQDKLSLTRLLIVADDRLEGAGRDVVVRWLDGQSGDVAADVEGFGNLLFVGSAIVAATHDLWCRLSPSRLLNEEYKGSRPNVGFDGLFQFVDYGGEVRLSCVASLIHSMRHWLGGLSRKMLYPILTLHKGVKLVIGIFGWFSAQFNTSEYVGHLDLLFTVAKIVLHSVSRMILLLGIAELRRGDAKALELGSCDGEVHLGTVRAHAGNNVSLSIYDDRLPDFGRALGSHETRLVQELIFIRSSSASCHSSSEQYHPQFRFTISTLGRLLPHQIHEADAIHLRIISNKALILLTNPCPCSVTRNLFFGEARDYHGMLATSDEYSNLWKVWDYASLQSGQLATCRQYSASSGSSQASVGGTVRPSGLRSRYSHQRASATGQCVGSSMGRILQGRAA